MTIRQYPFFIFVGVTLAGAVAYGAATAYPVEQSAEPVVLAAPVQPALIRELPPPEQADSQFVTVASVDALKDTFEAIDFRLAPVRRGHEPVPRVLLSELPGDYHTVQPVDSRKRLFFKTILPLVLRVNEEILAERRRLISLISIMDAGRELKPSDRNWLERLADRYRTNPGEFTTLLRRVDTVSPALTIAQSVEESGWGCSRFARDGNALFGQRVWSRGAGIVPEQRDDNEVFEVRSFGNLIDSVRSYALNLNRHSAYSNYRVERERLRATEIALDPYALADTLAGYSERREQYVETLKKILRTNRLEQFETARLQPVGSPTPTALGRIVQR